MVTLAEADGPPAQAHKQNISNVSKLLPLLLGIASVIVTDCEALSVLLTHTAVVRQLEYIIDKRHLSLK